MTPTKARARQRSLLVRGLDGVTHQKVKVRLVNEDRTLRDLVMAALDQYAAREWSPFHQPRQRSRGNTEPAGSEDTEA
jgi:hypothetical protein